MAQEGWDFLSPVDPPRGVLPSVQPPSGAGRHSSSSSTVRLHRAPRPACSGAGLERPAARVAAAARPLALLQRGCLPCPRLPAALAAGQGGRLAASLRQLCRVVADGPKASLQQFARRRGHGRAAEEEDEETQGVRADAGSTLQSAVAFLGLRRLGAGEICSGAGGLLAALAPLAMPGGALSMAPGGAVAAFCPFPLVCAADIPGLKHLGLHQCAPLPDLSLKELERGILVATFVQGSLGLMRICLGDAFSGTYTLLLATLGFNARHPGPQSNWLKTYVLITFINGTMGSIDIVQSMLLQNFPAVAVSLPLSVNLMHMVQLSVPGVSFLGAYCGWQHIKMQRRVANEAYQQQLFALMQQAPWPPPPLPFPLPGMPPALGLPGGGLAQVEDVAAAAEGRSPHYAAAAGGLPAGAASAAPACAAPAGAAGGGARREGDAAPSGAVAQGVAA